MPLKPTESTQGEDMHAGYIGQYAHYRVDLKIHQISWFLEKGNYIIHQALHAE